MNQVMLKAKQEELEETLINLYTELLEVSVPLETEISNILSEHFEELL